MWVIAISTAVGELPVVELDVNVVRSWFQFIAEVTAVVVIILGVRKRSDRKLRDHITAATQPIQPGYRNGGTSLQDLAVKLAGVGDTVSYLEHAHSEHRVLVLDVRERLADLSDRVDTNQDQAQRDLATLTDTVKANADAAAKLGLALQRQQPTDPPGDGLADLD